jgi:DNA invertase Pin-like site-specific DNA recombinase
MNLGYCRVSTQDQPLDQQRATLAAAGCTRIFEEKVSGAQRMRPELERLLDHARPDDVAVVVRLDRLARSTRDLLDIAERLNRQGVGLRSLAEPWVDSTNPAGRMVITVLSGIGEFERSLIISRTAEGRKFAREKRGVRFGRPPIITAEQWAHVEPQLREGSMSAQAAAALLKCNRATIYRRLASSTA